MKYEIFPLPYEFDSLEPYIDAQTVRLHYTKHHQGYVTKLNAALDLFPAWYAYSLEDLLFYWEQLPIEIQQLVRNNGGGHWAHTFFWNCMTPQALQPSLILLEKIANDFGSFDQFKEVFLQKATGFFGSGWVWLALNMQGALVLYATPNHDLPQRVGLIPLLVVDLWEHAYYVKYQNRRPEFLAAWWNLINWTFVEQQYQQALSARESDG